MPMAFGPGVPTRGELRPHVLLLQVLDGVPVEMQLLRDVPAPWRRAASPADVVGEALGECVLSARNAESLASHLATTAASHPPHLEFEIDPGIPVGEIAARRTARSYQP